MNDMRNLLEARGVEYAFYTNGSFLDNNALLYYAKEYDIPADRIIIPKSTRELVEAVYGFTSVSAIRMHSSIISYALNIPSVNLVWNDKILLFYENIGYPDRAFSFDSWSAETVANVLQEAESDTDYSNDKDYLMTLYDFLYDVMSGFFKKDKNEFVRYDFALIVSELTNDPVSLQEDVDELLIKVQKGEKHYLSRFIEMKKKDAEFKQLKKECDKKDKEINLLHKKIDKLNSLTVVKIYNKLRALKKKLFIR